LGKDVGVPTSIIFLSLSINRVRLSTFTFVKQEFIPEEEHPYKSLCSMACKNSYFKQINEKLPIKICAYSECKKEFKPNNNIQKFCSIKCEQNSFYHERHPIINKKIICLYCNKIFIIKSNKNRGQKFCCKSCYNKYYRQHNADKIKKYDRNHTLASSKIDVLQYTNSVGKETAITINKRLYPSNNKCEICGEEKRLLYHHWELKDKKAYGLWCCTKCHWLSEVMDVLELNINGALKYLELKEKISKEF
jgi:hypothetical protein